ncbi:hypothetical protein H257_10493 [Aphanomyces astaci]|uniref:Uncharacterized protein n=1 Tax=Aphanomyces astaci TaxID=112090 RepID=W4G6K4_APHAT|nr:hypothetical protein H257_10493 [Aphanomyces astaci]ETV75310.1 hypothetical protein H257_10493 [Aphanomyces astaci]|eukprot:XP_009835358.1 hypothetical protein H257_10493 [Aphanomyces astaci]
MGKQPSPSAEQQLVVPQPKRYRGGKVMRDHATALERVHASRSSWRPIEPPMHDELPLESCFDGLMLGSDMSMVHEASSWVDEGRPLSSASERSTTDFMDDDDDDPLSEDEELTQLCSST